jgi:hypothetical protein
MKKMITHIYTIINYSLKNKKIMRTKFYLLLIMLLTLSATTAFAQGLVTVATMTVADSRTANVVITVKGVAGETVSINGIEQTLLGSSTDNTFSIDVSTEKNIVIKATNASSITEMNCYKNELTSLNVSGLTSLGYLTCSDNNLTSLDVSSLTSLKHLSCSYNSLTSLDVSSCFLLTNLYCHTNSLTSLDVSGCVDLAYMTGQDQNVVVEVPFAENSIAVYFNSVAQTVTDGETFSFPLPAGIISGNPFSGTVSITRGADNRSRHNVTFISEEGVSIDRNSVNEVIEGYDFRFYTTIADEYAGYEVAVLVNGKELTPIVYDNMYIIENIVEDKEVTFVLIKKAGNTTANEELSTAKVSASVGTLTIEAPVAAAVQVVSFTGKVVYSSELVGTVTVNVPAGIYIVAIDGTATKVVVR